MAKPVLYILLSLKDKRTYIGYTDNLEERIKKHNSGKVKATRYRQPLILLHTEELGTLEGAKKREKYYPEMRNKMPFLNIVPTEHDKNKFANSLKLEGRSSESFLKFCKRVLGLDKRCAIIKSGRE
jgi:putative endonuclease